MGDRSLSDRTGWHLAVGMLIREASSWARVSTALGFRVFLDAVRDSAIDQPALVDLRGKASVSSVERSERLEA